MKLHAAVIASLLALASTTPVPESENPTAALEKRDKVCRVVTPDGTVACRTGPGGNYPLQNNKRITASERFGVDCTRTGSSVAGNT
ncbi:hypothetical protein W97_05213 [Coniosporium apollinis CBS 100218]|uniref:Uncharacterized protein n=1 Tax=Coniosporium apollinis (strain CBS 100218) TaxID=1168221 RepID=R7YWB2_CONA1|nr:uncharacterized protein W97_05213 [Coniosporium apollinis CBS 100218]EON65971.1 hypothetical protein W97_05213 [Coniosporium apollinis CBS 100218]